MADKFDLKAIISAVDRVSPTLRNISRNVNSFGKTFKRAGEGAVPMAIGLGAALAVPARAFMQAEDAATHLKNTLMTSDGLTKGFDELSKISVELGNKLPGTTADFMAMASQLKALGTDTDTLIGGALKASAYLAVVGKPLGVTYESAAEAVGKLSNAFGIAAQDLVPFTDTVQRALNMGIELEQFQYAMARISGPLKAAGMQGIKVANDMTPLVGMLIKAGISGEEAGTGIKTMITTAIAEGRFTGIKGLVQDLEKIGKLSAADQLAKLTDLFGKEHASKAAIVAAGGYQKMVDAMAQQAGLAPRVENSLGTLSNTIDAASGTLENFGAAVGKAYGQDLKDASNNINDFGAKMQAWAEKNPETIRNIIKLAGGFVATKLALYGVGVALAFVSRLLMLNPLGLFLNVLAIAVPFIIANWGTITAFFKSAWQTTVNWISTAWTNLVGGIKLGIEAMVTAFPMIGEVLKATFGGAIDWVTAKWQGLINIVSDAMTSIAGFMSSLGGANVGSMTLPGKARTSLVGNSSFKGSLDINHVNAPAGFRPSPVASKGPVRVQQNVGYNYMVTGQ